MSTFDEHFADLFRCCSLPEQSAQERGTALEECVAAVFATIPGVDVFARNARSVFDNEELDLVMSNRGLADGLPHVASFFSVECKNWSRPVGSTELSWFATKLRRSNQTFGVLVAARGVTGSQAGMTAAHFEVAAALAEGQFVVVLTLEEMQWLASGEELAQLLTEKTARLIAHRQVYILHEAPSPAQLPRWKLHAQNRAERNAKIMELCADVSASVGVDSGDIAVSIKHLRSRLEQFRRSEASEPSGAEIDTEFDTWSDENLRAFQAVQASLEHLGRSCIARLRSQPGSDWPPEQITLGLDYRAPANLAAPPDSKLAKLLLDYWADLIDFGPGYEHDGAILCILGWAVEWLLGTEHERWPPPWI